MKIILNRETKIILLQWLKRGYIETDDLPQLNECRNNWFEALIKRKTQMKTNKKEIKEVENGMV